MIVKIHVRTCTLCVHVQCMCVVCVCACAVYDTVSRSDTYSGS